MPRETKIWFLFPAPSTSCHAAHGVGSAPGTAAPPATDGFSASRSVLMFSEGAPEPRSWPSGIQMFPAPQVALEVGQNRLAKIWVVPPREAFGSYQEAHGAVRPGPAKSIEGASARTEGLMLRDCPWVVHAPFLKARTKMCWAPPTLCSNVAHGTFTP